MEAKQRMSSLAKRAKFVMSHSTGKLEVVGIDDDLIYLKYHQARDPDNIGGFLSLARDSAAMWLDELPEEDLYPLEEVSELV